MTFSHTCITINRYAGAAYLKKLHQAEGGANIFGVFREITDSQFNYLRMPLVEQDLLILPEKMSSPKVLMGFILLDL
jgi:hypothetical protein